MWTISPSRRSGGFAVPAAIFIVVVLAALAAFLVTIGSTQHQSHAQDVVSSRALQAARSGVEWGVYQVINTTATAANLRGYCNANDRTQLPVTLPTLTNLDGLTVTVDCTSVAYTDGATALHSYQITATACNNTTCPSTASPLPNLYVERRIVTLVTN